MEARLVALLNTHAKVYAKTRKTQGRTPLLTTRSDRVEIVRWLCFIDPSGTWGDAESLAIDIQPLTSSEAVYAAAAFLR